MSDMDKTVRTESAEPRSDGISLKLLLRLLSSPDRRARLRRQIGHKLVARPPVAYFNEAVNPDLGLIYVAVPKTGSTTIREQISPVPYRDLRYFEQAAHLDLLQIKRGLVYFEQHMGLDRNRSFPHEVGSTAELEARALAFFDTAFKFSTVRNPWARAVSLYFRKEGVQVSGDLSFAEFIERHEYASDTCRSSTLHRSQLDWLRDETGEIATDYVFRIEDLDSEIDKLREVSGGRVQLTPARRSNVNKASRSGDYRDMYDDRLRKLVAERFAEDIDYFGYTF